MSDIESIVNQSMSQLCRDVWQLCGQQLAMTDTMGKTRPGIDAFYAVRYQVCASVFRLHHSLG